MTPPATPADIVGSALCPKLMDSGSSAEQPSPASPKTRTPSQGSSCGSAAVRVKVPTSTSGRMWNVTRADNQRPIDANSTRPAVTIAQNAVRASDAWVVVAPSSDVMSSWDQLPFMVSQMP